MTVALALPSSEVTKWVLADWLEARLIFGESRAISVASLTDELVDEATLPDLAVYDETETDLADLDEDEVRRTVRSAVTEGDNPEALLAEEAIEELEHRAEFVGAHYPIEVSHSVARSVLTSWQEAPVYAFLTGLNVRYLWKVQGDTNVPSRLFERLTVPALRAYWGGEAAHFGWPRDRSEEPGFRAALPALIGRMRERLNFLPAELSGQHNDLAVDAAAWRPLDFRPGQSVLLCQCSIGDDWHEKGVPLDKWATLVNFAVAPIRGLAFPFVPDAVRALNDVDWLLLCAGVGIPLDRLRVAHLLADAEFEPAFLDAIKDWTGRLVAAIGDPAAAA